MPLKAKDLAHWLTMISKVVESFRDLCFRTLFERGNVVINSMISDVRLPGLSPSTTLKLLCDLGEVA